VISVIVPTCNRELSLVRTVAALVATSASEDCEDYEIVVVNDGDPFTAKTMKLLHAIGCARIIQSNARNVAVARNLGADAASGRILAFLDDDVIPGPGWLRLITQTLCCAHSISGITGRVASISLGTRVLDRLRERVYDRREARIRDTVEDAKMRIGIEAYAVNYFSGGNCALPIEIFREAGGFAPEFTKSQDRELALRIIAGGGSVYYIPDLEVYHDNGQVGWSSLMRGRYLSGYFAAHLEKRHPQDFAARSESMRPGALKGSPSDRIAYLGWAISFNFGLYVGRWKRTSSDSEAPSFETL
jgi:glycosyltransferase involved in cell wall biosynthesis